MEPSPELSDLTRRIYEALAKGDYAFFERRLSRQEGLLVIGSDPDEWWTGYDTFSRVLRSQFEELRGFKVTGNPQAWSERSVGWAADQAKFTTPDGAEMPFRISLTFRRENGDWKIVAWHSSVGVPNEDLLGKALTTG